MSVALLSVLSFLLSLAITALAVGRLLPLLREKAKQPIYTEGPSWHISKSGTPTMGGIAFLLAASLVLGLCVLTLTLEGYRKEALSLGISLLYALFSGAIGIADDLKKLSRKENAGLSPREKLLFQSLLAVFFLLARNRLCGDLPAFTLFGKSATLGFLYYLIAFVALVGTANAANLTDGLDGLASTVAFGAALSMFYVSYRLSYSVPLLASSVAGIAIGFLFFNLHPAKIFMGDTGSLFFGGAIGAGAFMLGNPLLLLFFGIVYLIEALSVIVQVVSFKLTGKRVFRMAPIHHHLEQCGFGENAICLIALLITLAVSALGFIVL